MMRFATALLIGLLACPMCYSFEPGYYEDESSARKLSDAWRKADRIFLVRKLDMIAECVARGHATIPLGPMHGSTSVASYTRDQVKSLLAKNTRKDFLLIDTQYENREEFQGNKAEFLKFV